MRGGNGVEAYDLCVLITRVTILFCMLAAVELAAVARAQEHSVAEIKREYRALANQKGRPARERRIELARMLGTIPGKASRDALLLFLSSEESPATRHELMRSIGAVGDRGAVSRMTKAAGHRMSAATRLALAEALAQTSSADVRKWIRDSLLASRSRDARLAAVDALSRLNDPDAAPALRKLLDKSGKDLPMQMECIHALRQDLHVQKRMARAQEWKLRWATAKALREAHPSGDLLKSLRDDSVGAVRRAAGNDEAKHVGSIFGLPIRARSVLFVLDTSASMKALDAPPQRIDTAKRQLLKAIKSLDPSARFGLMVFSSSVSEWDLGPVLASATSKTEARAWIHRRALCRGYKNMFGALSRAIAAGDKYDTVVLISDNVPNAGRVEQPKEFLAEVRELNRFDQVRIHTVAITFGRPKMLEIAGGKPSPRRAEEFFRLLSQQNGGTMKIVSKPFFDLR